MLCRKPARGAASRFSSTTWRLRMTALGFVSKLLPRSRRRRGKPVRKPTRARLGVEPLEERALLSANVLQTNLVSDLPGVAQLQDPHLVNPWGISDNRGSALWVSDNNAGVTTLYNAPAMPAAGQSPVSINPLVVGIPTPIDPLGATGAPTGTVGNLDNGPTGGFKVSGLDKNGNPITASSVFLFATEDGTLIGWNPAVDPTGKFDGPGGASTHAVIAVDNSGNNFTEPDPLKQTGAVYKGLSFASSATPGTPIFASDPSSTSVLYAANFRSGQVEVYDPNFNRVSLPAGAFADPKLPDGFAPFNVQVLGGKVYVSYALQDAAKHDDVGGNGHGFIDVFNLDGTPGLPGGQERLVSHNHLDSPWGMALAPSSFGNVANDLLVGNFRSGFIDIFNPTTGKFLGQLKDPDGEPINIDHLWTLMVGNGGNGGNPNLVYFTAGIDNEMHGLFGSLTPVAPGTPEGPADAQVVVAALDVVQLDLTTLISDINSGASQSTIAQDTQTLNTDSAALTLAEQQFAKDSRHDQGMAAMTAPGAHHAAAMQNIDRLFAAGWNFDL
ncbi:MAG TPA: TIGR03118 family protein [Gemmataceae bacterium]|nr:TIGR03118 family protein [Gemmataceae bacterium]